MYTLEIGGVAVAMTDAEEAEARALFESDEFKEDLKEFTSDGTPIWDGTTPFVVRPANEDEIDLFDEALEDEDDEDDADLEDLEALESEEAADEDSDDDEDGDEAEVMFLVPVDQFQDDEV